MKGARGKNKFTANTARVESATLEFLTMLSGSYMKNNNYQTSPCKQFYKIQVEVLCKLPQKFGTLANPSFEVYVFETPCGI